MIQLAESPTEEKHEFDFKQRGPRTSVLSPCRVIVSCVLLILPVILLASLYRHGISPIDSIHNAWSLMGAADKVTLPQCERTLLFVFGGTKGFGSSMGIYVRAALYAQNNNYTLLVTTSPQWVYGKFEDYFDSPVLNCQPTDEMYSWRKDRMWVGAENWQSSDHLVMARGNYIPIDEWLIANYINLEEYALLPAIDSSVPLPPEETLPPILHRIFVDLHHAFRSLWRPRGRLDAMVDSVLTDLGLSRDSRTGRGHVIGVHYRGGDKFAHECVKEDNCGNATVYLEAALESVNRLPIADCPTCKPVLALMTIEPDVKEMFEADALSENFDIRLLPPPATGLKGHDQKTFNSWPLEERIDDTMTMLRDLTVLAIHADAFILTGSSNVGIVAMMLGGPTKVLRSIDQRFQPTTRWLWSYLPAPPASEEAVEAISATEDSTAKIPMLDVLAANSTQLIKRHRARRRSRDVWYRAGSRV